MHCNYHKNHDLDKIHYPLLELLDNLYWYFLFVTILLYFYFLLIVVTSADIEASNGVIHVIDKVLLPESDDAAADDVPKTGSVGMIPFIGLAAISGLGIIASKKKK